MSQSSQSKDDDETSDHPLFCTQLPESFESSPTWLALSAIAGESVIPATTKKSLDEQKEVNGSIERKSDVRLIRTKREGERVQPYKSMLSSLRSKHLFQSPADIDQEKGVKVKKSSTDDKGECHQAAIGNNFSDYSNNVQSMGEVYLRLRDLK